MDIRQQNIIKYSDIILDHLLKYKEVHHDFTFSLRQRDFAKADSPKRLENGQWFQGSDYIFVPLFKIGDSNRKIKTFGFALNFDKSGNITSSTITISCKGGVTNKKDIDFHKKLAKEIGIELNDYNCGDFVFESPTSIIENLDYYLNTVRPTAIRLLNEFKLEDKYTYSETDFQKYLSRINEIRDSSEINYWIFQGSPKIYDAVTALNDNSVLTWTVSAHKDKIKEGDKFILWLTGANAGCYALGTIASEVTMMKEDDTEMSYYLSPTSQVENNRVRISIDYNLTESPILWEMVKDEEAFSNFKGNNQGTNFTATKEQYETFLDLASMEKDNFEKVLQNFEFEDLKSYFNLLFEIVDTLNLKQGEERLLFTYRKDRLSFTIGQRIALLLLKKHHKGKYFVLTKDKIRPTSENFAGKEPLPFGTYLNELDLVQSEKQSLFDGVLQELKRVKKSSYRSKNYSDFEKAVFDPAFRLRFQKITNPIMSYNAPINQILYGPPGTGKTYNTVLEAAKIVTRNEHISYDEALAVFKSNLDTQIEFITFHQNYSYEDFIQGLRPDTENGTTLSFEKKDGVFKRIADRALKNLEASKNPASAKKEFEVVFQELIQPLNDGDVEEIEIKMKKSSFYITEVGEKSIGFRKNIGDSEHTLSISTLHKMYDKGVNEIILGGLQPYYNPILDLLLEKGKSQVTAVPRKNYVIIIDEINRANISRVFGELITLIEEDKRSEGEIPMRVTLPSGDSFIVPSNLYIIGTMNTADKSIALLDVALRRRFEFKPMYPLYCGLEKPIHDAELLQKINDAILSRKNHDFTIGHAYFMGDKYTKEKTINNKVIPLLLEYFMNDEKEVVAILQAAGITIGGWPLKMI